MKRLDKFIISCDVVP